MNTQLIQSTRISWNELHALGELETSNVAIISRETPGKMHLDEKGRTLIYLRKKQKDTGRKKINM
jgi:hypothetical protein